MPAKLIPIDRPFEHAAAQLPLSYEPAANAAPNTAPISTRKAPLQFTCPRCGNENSPDAHFCVACHQILIHRCPNCWHEQRTGPICENCGTNMPLYWEVALEKSMGEENRLWWARMWAAASWLAQIMMLPFSSVAGLARGLALRLLAARIRNR